MMQRQSPPKHRHDGTSPLPLGMDWSPPPRKWNGRDTVWPHDPGTGWSYCVTIPSWVVRPKTRDSDPVVEHIDSMRLTATSQGSVANDCDVAEKLSHSRVLGRGVGVKGKKLNGCASSGQGKDCRRDEDVEADLKKMKAESAETAKQLSQMKDRILQFFSKTLIPTVQASNAQPCSRELI